MIDNLDYTYTFHTSDHRQFFVQLGCMVEVAGEFHQLIGLQGNGLIIEGVPGVVSVDEVTAVRDRPPGTR